MGFFRLHGFPNTPPISPRANPKAPASGALRFELATLELLVFLPVSHIGDAKVRQITGLVTVVQVLWSICVRVIGPWEKLWYIDSIMSHECQPYLLINICWLDFMIGIPQFSKIDQSVLTGDCSNCSGSSRLSKSATRSALWAALSKTSSILIVMAIQTRPNPRVPSDADLGNKCLRSIYCVESFGIGPTQHPSWSHNHQSDTWIFGVMFFTLKNGLSRWITVNSRWFTIFSRYHFSPSCPFLDPSEPLKLN